MQTVYTACTNESINLFKEYSLEIDSLHINDIIL